MWLNIYYNLSVKHKRDNISKNLEIIFNTLITKQKIYIKIAKIKKKILVEIVASP